MDTSLDFNRSTDKLLVRGITYLSDGKTPRSNVAFTFIIGLRTQNTYPKDQIKVGAEYMVTAVAGSQAYPIDVLASSLKY